ncbi:MAG: hypothetical protein NC254_08335 [bacterium]|nr:hypothetical protein [bacterium]
MAYLQGAAIPEELPNSKTPDNERTKIEEVEPDEWDLEMISNAAKNNDGSSVSFEERLKKEGLTYADL